MFKNMYLTLSDTEKFYSVMKTLASRPRLMIMQVLSEKGMSVNEIAERLDIPLSTAAMHIKILESNGLIRTSLQPGRHGTLKLCSIKYETLDLSVLEMAKDEYKAPFICSMPLGAYSDCYIKPTCGLASEVGYIGNDDDPKSFYSAERFKAQLIWFYQGFVEYRFPRQFDEVNALSSINFSAEICSEAPYYRSHWPSDITIWVNGTEIGTWTCPGDFGGRRGNNTPSWWSISSTQYGLLKCWTITHKGTDIDHVHLSDYSLTDLASVEQDYISFRVGVKSDAHNIGGINIFGRKFGDFPQNIEMRMDYISL